MENEYYCRWVVGGLYIKSREELEYHGVILSLAGLLRMSLFFLKKKKNYRINFHNPFFNVEINYGKS